jgi:predicted GIY-YIG superfamily endonuclease
MSLYELECEEDYHYIGTTTRDVDTRYREHQTGDGAAVTRRYPPVRLVSSCPVTTPHDEDNATKDAMRKYGVDKVYGGSYAQFPRPPEVTAILHRTMDTIKGACYTCHLPGHYTTDCPTSRPKTPETCRKCQQPHSVWDCPTLDAQETAPEPSPSSGKVDVEIQTDIPMEEVQFTVTFKRQPCAPVQAPVSRRTRSQTGPVMTRSQSRARGRAGI